MRASSIYTHFVGVLALAGAASSPLGCYGAEFTAGVRQPTLRATNVTRVRGTDFDVVPQAWYGRPTLERWGPNGLHANRRFWCGTPVEVTSAEGVRAYGRVVVFSYRDGRGPEGRGDYLLEVPGSTVRTAADGRRAFYAATYRDRRDTQTYIAWFIVLDSAPIPCTPTTREEWSDGRY